jgi:2-oxoglutarate ferredoxin oxidoreductase subunit beta
MNHMGEGFTMMEWQRDHAVTVAEATKMSEEQMVGKFRIGVLHQSLAPEYVAEYEKIIAKAQGRQSK